MKRNLFALAAVAAAAIGVLGTTAHAQGFPDGKPITIVVPFAAGGPTDRV
ncbi:MAG: tripartite tricarboxylate transporter substrate binding protein BugD, partial [Proteobacteria bacterium]|nr:tripartite tricarboxylate transporter substrate binding protein BugD [Pseudomonadota bacterium]